jgi:hypothetical protein
VPSEPAVRHLCSVAVPKGEARQPSIPSTSTASPIQALSPRSERRHYRLDNLEIVQHARSESFTPPEHYCRRSRSDIVAQRSGRAATRAASDGGVTDELIKAAQKEGSITYYHVTPVDVTNSWTKAFSQKYGISTKNVRGPGYPTWDKWLNESRVGRHICDVIQVTDQSIIEPADKEGFVAHYTPTAGAIPI